MYGKTIFKTDMMNTPMIVPTTEPTPPASEVPPTTTRRWHQVPYRSLYQEGIVEYVAAYAIPAKPARSPLMT